MIGSLRMRLPVTAKTALAIAGRDADRSGLANAARSLGALDEMHLDQRGVSLMRRTR